MNLSLILVAAVWCVFGRGEAASLEGPHNLENAPLMGGSPADPNIVQPHIADLMLKVGDEYIKICEATLVKQVKPFAFFVTPAECIDRKM